MIQKIDFYLRMNVFKGNFRMFFKLWQALNKWDVIILNNFTQFLSKSIVFIIGTKNSKDIKETF